ncbi:aspartyl/asparaginyl beta-hydroxylase domain-containing protein [Novosphingobium sp.]|uniref:aspartyl/asparaginyl beta-hydroxylase domain-containing protein n=1 Tax=Novosphingobium sp. TaxID=1874826 RepID=UPI0035B4DD97
MTAPDQHMQQRLAEADRALAGGNLPQARELLESLVSANPQVPAFWHRLATVRRMAGEPRGALVAIDRALGIVPLDFVGLLVRAALLDQLGDGEAGEAYGRALAQRRPDPMPPMLVPVIARAETAWRAYQESLENRLHGALEHSGLTLTGEERRRAERLASNISRRTRIYHSEATHFHYPNLREVEYWDPAEFPWLAEVEAATEDIAAELAIVAAAEAAERVPYVQYEANEPLAQWRSLNYNMDWTAIHLIQRGKVIEANAALCPRTMDLMARMPQPWIEGCGANAMFSLLAPRTAIPPHGGVANTRLLCHLPLVVPGKCWFRVGDQVRDWERGKPWVFDDSIEHEAMNETDELRVILIFDVWYPDLSPAERAAVSTLIGAAAMPVGAL